MRTPNTPPDGWPTDTRRVDDRVHGRDRYSVALTVRPAHSRDAAALAELGAGAFCATYIGLLDDTTIEAVVAQTCTPPAFVELADRPEPNRLLVADEDGVLQGFLDFAREPEGLELRRLYTRPGETSRGVGGALLAALEATLAAGTTYRIVVVPGNVRGLAFWKRHGFCEQGGVDGIEHFAAHRNVQFQPGSRSAPLLVLHRSITHSDT